MSKEKQVRKVLLAIRAVDVPAVSRYLGQEFEYLYGFSLNRAKEILQSQNVGWSSVASASILATCLNY